MTSRDERQRGQRHEHDGPDGTDGENKEEEEEYLRDIGYQPNVNQVRQEPIPASDYAEHGQLGELRSEEAAKAAAAHQRRKSRTESPPDGKSNG